MLAELFLRGRNGEFVYPLAPVPRTAVLVPWFPNIPHRSSNVRVFPCGWCREAAAFAPASIAATLPQVIALAQGPFEGPPQGPPLAPTHALVMLARFGENVISEAQRDWLWRKFQVPVFEQIIGLGGELLASECEAHDGLHAYIDESILRGEAFDTSPCPCGRKSPRIRALRGADLERRMAAFAR